MSNQTPPNPPADDSWGQAAPGFDPQQQAQAGQQQFDPQAGWNQPPKKSGGAGIIIAIIAVVVVVVGLGVLAFSFLGGGSDDAGSDGGAAAGSSSGDGEVAESMGYADMTPPAQGAEEVTIDGTGDGEEVEVGPARVEIHEIREWDDGDYEAELTVWNATDASAAISVELVLLDGDTQVGSIFGTTDELDAGNGYHADFVSFDVYNPDFDTIIVRAGDPES